jgi:hypothetical protein
MEPTCWLVNSASHAAVEYTPVHHEEVRSRNSLTGVGAGNVFRSATNDQ